MATSSMSVVIQQLRGAVLREGAELTDGELLGAFVHQRDDAALAALVRRHGPMIWGVCRRLLHSHHDAEDAFQATFVTLVRKATTIQPMEMVGNWLYGVARHTAVKARAIAARKSARERQIVDMSEPAALEQEVWHDLQPVLDLELSRLPEKYRVLIVLCDLEGKTRKEAARQLGCPEGTMASRLARARTMLARRLTRRGVTLSGGLLGAMLPAQAAPASVPATVMCSTIQSVTPIAGGKSASACAISANVAAISQGVIKAMQLMKLKTVTTLILLLSMGMFTTAMLAWGQAPDKGVANSAAKPEKEAPPAQPKGPPKDFTNGFGMKFVWIPPGNFLMGTPKGEERGQIVHDETQHKVTLTKGFYMGVYPVTQEQWQEVMGANPSQFKGEKNLPVEMVSWNDCEEFIEKLRERDKKPYRLPTEAEREYSCRAGTTTPFNFGDTISTDQANYDGSGTYGRGKQGANREKTTPVGSFPANAWGLYDMHGNVVQWCQDWLGDYPKDDVVDPQGPETGKARLVRGGSWYGHPQYLRSAFRYAFEPDFRHGRVGLRVCFCPE
jgi:RNA polymerase sigma factor (sigma-70 family)